VVNHRLSATTSIDKTPRGVVTGYIGNSLVVFGLETGNLLVLVGFGRCQGMLVFSLDIGESLIVVGLEICDPQVVVALDFLCAARRWPMGKRTATSCSIPFE